MSSDSSKIYNIEAEQNVLGAIISNNEFLDHVIEFLKPNHFYDAIHKAIFTAILTLTERGLTAHHISIIQHIGHTEIGKEVKEKNYLLYLTAISVATFNVKEYASMVYDLAIRREIVFIATNMISTANSSGLDNTAINQIESAESSLFNLIEHGSSESGFINIKSAIKSSIEHINNCRKKGVKTTGIPSGLTDLDDIIHGFHDSDLIILAARPGMGKTTLMLNFAYESGVYFMPSKENINKNEQKSVGIFSLEMQSVQLATKLISTQSSVDSSSLMSGRIKEEQYNDLKKVQEWLVNLPIYIDDTAALSISSIRTRARRLKRKHNLGILYIDYLQLIQPSKNKNMQNRVLEITEITQGLKALAKELNIPIIALSQLSREVEKRADKRPMLSDLRESGSIEQDADVVMFIYRDEYYDSMKSQSHEGNQGYSKSQAQTYNEQKHDSKNGFNKNKAEIIIAKHRKGRTGFAEIYFDAELSKFSDFSKRHT